MTISRVELGVDVWGSEILSEKGTTSVVGGRMRSAPSGGSRWVGN